ncbi:lamin tail domain-containing protein [Candidatus Kaiserbacteria bacterium]|nr:lamin tail domain-containing protein [Candidatus Kaiserbacteria bacterium]
MHKYFLVFAFLALPAAAHAAVLINEVAWMGTTVSANAEWIELANTGAAPVDLSGWRLMAASSSPAITLTGSIAASGYYLLERTSDNSVPNISADQIYTGALPNSGTTLTLFDATGATENTIVGGLNWVNIGGDNKSKKTAQRLPAQAGTATSWETATPTPRAANATSAPAVAAKLPAPPMSSTRVQKVEAAVGTSLSEPTHEETAVIAPATTTPLAAAGAAEPTPRSAGLLSSPWMFGFIGLLVAAAGAFILL